MVTFDYISHRGDIMPLAKNDNFALVNIDSQTVAATSISAATAGGADGDTVNSVRANPRTIIIDLLIKGNVEESKRYVLGFVKIKQKCQLKWVQNDRTLLINGIIEEIDMPRWNNEVAMQITIHCSDPFWEDIDTVISQISEAVSIHYFTDIADDMLYFIDTGIPFGEYDTMRTKTFYNAGDVAVGMEIEILAVDTVTNPIITNADGQFFGIGYGTGNKQVVMSSGDKIIVKTGRNVKSVMLNGTSLLSKIKPSSTWLQMNPGDNAFVINADDVNITNMVFNIIYKQKFI